MYDVGRRSLTFEQCVELRWRLNVADVVETSASQMVVIHYLAVEPFIIAPNGLGLIPELICAQSSNDRICSNSSTHHLSPTYIPIIVHIQKRLSDSMDGKT